MQTEINDKTKLWAFLSYITIFGTLFIIIYNNERKHPFIAFHCRQALGLWITYMLIALTIFPLDIIGVYYGFWIFIGVLFIYSMIGAITGKYNEAPLLGSFFQKWFKGIGQ